MNSIPEVLIDLESSGFPVAHGFPEHSRRPDYSKRHESLIRGHAGSKENDVGVRMMGWRFEFF